MSVTPDFVGQRYKDTNTGNIWIANSTTPGDWTLEVQNMGFVWTPTNVKFQEKTGYWADASSSGLLSGVTSLVVNHAQNVNGYDWNLDFSDLISLTFPNLTSTLHLIVYGPNVTTVQADLLQSIDKELDIQCASLLTISFPALTTLGSGLSLYNCTSATALSFPQLSISGDVGGTMGLQIGGCTSLPSISFPSLQTVGGFGTTIFGCSSATEIRLPLMSTSSGVAISGNVACEEIDLGSLLTGSLAMEDNTVLESVILTAYSPTNGDIINISNANLPSSQVNSVLAKAVANAAYLTGSIVLNGGTNGAPTGQGATDKATLIARGVTVTTN